MGQTGSRAAARRRAAAGGLVLADSLFLGRVAVGPNTDLPECAGQVERVRVRDTVRELARLSTATPISYFAGERKAVTTIQTETPRLLIVVDIGGVGEVEVP